VRATPQVHLTHDQCLEVIVLKGRADHLRERAAENFVAKNVTGRIYGSPVH
jgi:metal-responsive CopG/Arc/MetJ family transcriptional regulator